MSDRETAILKILEDEGFARIPQLAVRLGVSESTVRRVLHRLDVGGKINRAVGGAVLAQRVTISSPPDYAKRGTLAMAEKTAIAQAAAELVQDGDTVFLGGGSTVGQMSQFLQGRPLQIVTNSLAIAASFQDCPATEVLVVGGYLFPRHRLLSGPITNATLSDLRFTWAFIGGGGFDAQELTDWNVLMAEANRIALLRAEHTAALIDSSKYNRRVLSRVCGLQELEYLVSGELPLEARDALASAGTRYVCAAGESPGGGRAAAVHPNGETPDHLKR